MSTEFQGHVLAVAERIKAAFEARGHHCEICWEADRSNPRFVVDGQSARIVIIERYSGSGMYRRPTGKLGVRTTDERFHTRSFPPRKDGTHSYDVIVTEVEHAFRERVEREAARSRRIAVEPAVMRLRQGFGLASWVHVNASETGKIEIQIAVEVTEEDAREILTTVKRILEGRE